MGSLHTRGRVWWMVYRDVDGRRVQENSYTSNRDLALRRLAAAALVEAQAETAALERIACETQSAGARE
jgi:hypothetical protein